MTKKGAPRTEAAKAGAARRRRTERETLTFADLEAQAIPEPNSGCLLWLGRLSDQGYSRTSAGNAAHRLAYEKTIGPIPDGHESDHLCRVRCCIEPRHLEPVTHLENLRRGVGILERVGLLTASKTHCPQGHAYAGGNLHTRKNGARECRACMRERTARRRAAEKEKTVG